MQAVSWSRGLGQVWVERKPEMILLALGVLLRLSLPLTFPVEQGYDFPFHWAYVEYLGRFGELPPGTLNAATYQHPLYYAIAAGLWRAGLSAQGIALFSALCGAARLILIWRGLERYLPQSRLARCGALLAAGFLPATVHLDGMVQGEALSNLLATIALLIAPRALCGALRQRWRAALWLGLVMGLELLTKVSGVVLLAAFAAAALLDVVLRGEKGTRERLRRLAPWLACAGVVASIAGWWFVRNQQRYGKWTVTAFDLNQKSLMRRYQPIPYLDRRSLGFVAGWTTSIYRHPYAPSGNRPARFFPVVLASTFSDYYNFGFCPPPLPGQPNPRFNGRPGPRRAAILLSQASVVGGTLVALATLCAWLGAFVHLWRRRELERLALLLVPLLAVAGQLHFAIKFPIDAMGVIKGAYLQFASPVLYAMFGLAVGWLWQRRRGRPWALVCLAAFAPVLAYTLYCRVVVPLVDLLSR